LFILKLALDNVSNFEHLEQVAPLVLMAFFVFGVVDSPHALKYAVEQAEVLHSLDFNEKGAQSVEYNGALLINFSVLTRKVVVEKILNLVPVAEVNGRLLE